MEYVVTIFILVTFAFGDFSGYSSSSAFSTHFVYQLAHASLLHLAINAYAVFSLIRILKQIINPYRLVITAYLISVVASFVSVYDLPTVGASGFAYALIGAFARALYDKKISFQKQPYLLIFHSGVALGILITLIHPGSNGLLHLLSYIFGFFLLKVRSGSSVWS